MVLHFGPKDHIQKILCHVSAGQRQEIFNIRDKNPISVVNLDCSQNETPKSYLLLKIKLLLFKKKWYYL